GNVEGRICQYFQKFENQSHDPRNETVMCKNNDYCYGIWVQTSDGAFHPDKQGCWPSSNVLSCNSTCADNTSKSHSFYSCCCNTDMCNSHPPRVAPKVHQAPIHGKSSVSLPPALLPTSWFKDTQLYMGFLTHCLR
ncbi:hypothetical protein scyTo_0024758, partial [Scyliorhinus torazame]|nr:hypothetical protein [Scyliorhinus torazame]